MKSSEYIKKIKLLAAVSFIVPLVAINSCLLLYKFLGDFHIYPNISWNKEIIKYTYPEYETLIDANIVGNYNFTNCPKLAHKGYLITDDNEKIFDLWIGGSKKNIIPEGLDVYLKNLKENNKITHYVYEKTNTKNNYCVKNHPITYSILKKFNSLEKLLMASYSNEYPPPFGGIRNPYIYGEVSISRTARFFPSNLIFKPLIIISAIFLFFYWKNNLNQLNTLNYNKNSKKISKKFFYFGTVSCIFLMLHAIFLGMDFDSKLFDQFRRLVISLFIICEVCAQILLTKNLLKFKELLKEFINLLILKIKVIFVSLVFVITLVSFIIMFLGYTTASFNHILEWNYFSFLLVYYLLSNLLWKSK